MLFYVLNELVSALFVKEDRVLDLLVADRVKILQRTILKLVLDSLDTESVRDRGKNLHILKRFVSALLLRHTVHCAHIVQSVGKLDDNNPYVVCH